MPISALSVLVVLYKWHQNLNFSLKRSIDPFHDSIQFEVKDVIPCAVRNLHRIIMLQLHIQNNFMCC